MNDKSIRIDHVSFSYGRRSILADISLTIPAGSVYALVGRSGTGKTTLLNLTGGFLTPNEGEIRVGATVVREAGLIRGVVFAEDSLLDWLTVQENVLFPDRTSGPGAENANRLLNAVGLVGIAHAYPFQLSTGMRRRVELVRALVRDERFVLLDEPFTSVDAISRREMWHAWQKLTSSERRTGILSTHDPEDALAACDAVVGLVGSMPARMSQPIPIPLQLRDGTASAAERENFVAGVLDLYARPA